LRAALQINPGYAGARNGLATALRKIGRLDEAILEYREALRLKKDNPQIHTNLALALADRGIWDEAIAEYREALASKQPFPPRDGAHCGIASVHRGLGDALRATGRLDEAIHEYREAIRLDKDYSRPHLSLGALLCDDRRDYDGAIDELRE